MSYVNAKLGKQSDGLKAFQISSVIQLKVNKRCKLFVHSVLADICWLKLVDECVGFWIYIPSKAVV